MKTLREMVNERDEVFESATEDLMADHEYIRAAVCECLKLNPRHVLWESVEALSSEDIMMFSFRSIDAGEVSKDGVMYERIIHVGIPFDVVDLGDKNVIFDFLSRTDCEIVNMEDSHAMSDLVDEFDDDLYSSLSDALLPVFGFNPNTIH